MKKILVVLAATILIAGTASAAIGVGAGWSGIYGLNANVIMGLGGMNVEGVVAFWPTLGFGGNVLISLPALMDGKIVPFAGGGAIMQPSYYGTSLSLLWVGGKGGVEYKLSDTLVAYGGAGYYYPIILGGSTGWWAIGGFGIDAGVRFQLGN